MKLLDFLRKIKRHFSKYQHIVEVLISKENILHNLSEYEKAYPDFLFAPVLKSNAYGHGLVEVAKILDKKNLPFFVVDSLYEARFLRHHHIKTPILIIGYTLLNNIQNYNAKDFIFTIVSLEELKNLSQNISKETKVHLKVDTGMRRQGILMEEIEELKNLFKKNPKLILEGVCSHLADADNADPTFTHKQIAEWKKVETIFKNTFSNIKYFHLSATSGVEMMDKDFTNLVRLGIGLYGINVTNNKKLNLKPALEMRTIVSSIRKVKAGESVGYNKTFTFEDDGQIATIPVGYFEGVDRRLSNLGIFKIKNIFANIIGRVSMNMTMVDISKYEEINTGEPVVVVSGKEEDENSVVNIAKKINTIPYEVLVHFPAGLHRKVVKRF